MTGPELWLTEFGIHLQLVDNYLQGEFDCLRGRHHWQEVGEALQGGQTDVVARVAVSGAGGRAAVVSVTATAGTKSKHKT